MFFLLVRFREANLFLLFPTDLMEDTPEQSTNLYQQDFFPWKRTKVPWKSMVGSDVFPTKLVPFRGDVSFQGCIKGFLSNHQLVANWWFGNVGVLLRIPIHFIFGDPQESEITGPQTTNLPLCWKCPQKWQRQLWGLLFQHHLRHFQGVIQTWSLTFNWSIRRPMIPWSLGDSAVSSWGSDERVARGFPL